ncbi:MULTISPECIES: hypothetical protein [unclassified Hydrogenobaculum]|jgi:hypothetical protein|uniref:hypothetical protein n=1 Tax=unclassified Hydrogenobaculum TaxID=2622382 RepID=UPI0001C51C30|nr:MULTISPECIES: hypothetical protein [unclassified Hydrogenobaculum]AEF19826.1 hypothetical protein Hyd3684_1447 [Hydrogenobaculum sp. 3684]AEG47112.1 hypothetical protein HydSHO_1449 [Hydrogenobaculum sp. SHO]AGG15760.1 hypothetical protein HydHO_1452 [Hydrogenobaculum sp. HO]AGH94060.1 hypothetical protein HydSN_1494 [Hydrogenobaculum sp. SN]
MKNLLKVGLTVGIWLLVFNTSYANDGIMLNQEKAYLLEVIHDKIDMLQNMEICVDQAQSWKDLKGCNLYELWGGYMPPACPYPNPYYCGPMPWMFERKHK